MRKNLSLKYFVLLAAVVLLAFLLLCGYLFTYNVEYFLHQNTVALQDGAKDISSSVTTMMDLSHQDFAYLLEEEEKLLLSTFAAQKRDEGMEIFATDSYGKVLISTDESLEGRSVPAKAVEEAFAQGKTGTVYESDLGGFLGENSFVRSIPMEKQLFETRLQRVGLIFITGTASGLNDYSMHLLRSFLITSLVLLLAVAAIFFLLSRALVEPMEEISRATESFAKGDFSIRLSEKKAGDLTPLVRTLNVMLERVEKNETIRQNFVSNVSHDLKTPLTTIGGFVQNLKLGTIPPEKADHYYDIILSEVERLSRLVHTLLETSRMTAGERKYQFAPMDLCELGRITLLSFEDRLEKKKIDVSFDAEVDSLFVSADRDAISQVIYNLMDNAIKFTPDEGRLSIAVSTSEDKAFFAVKNTGEGIPEEEVVHLFDRFYKSDRSRGLDKKGMGLGLFIAKSILSAHGEEIWVESRVGEETEFVFSLPRCARPERKESVQ